MVCHLCFPSNDVSLTYGVRSPCIRDWEGGKSTHGGMYQSRADFFSLTNEKHVPFICSITAKWCLWLSVSIYGWEKLVR